MTPDQDCRVKNAREDMAIYLRRRSAEEMAAAEDERKANDRSRTVRLTTTAWVGVRDAISDTLEMLDGVRHTLLSGSRAEDMERDDIGALIRIAVCAQPGV